jgi:hypothetical protein
MRQRNSLLVALVTVLAVGLYAVTRAASPIDEWTAEFPRTDFSKTSINFSEIVADGPRRDTIPPIFKPEFVAAAEVTDVGPMEPVLSIIIKGDARAYPLRILLWHEIVNDVVGGVPILVSYCPLCNSGVIFDRRFDGEVLTFGNTGRIRHFDMVMYDRQSESWWQQFLGEAIIGSYTGARLTALPARLESLERFRARAPDGLLQVPSGGHVRSYGATPFAGMETRRIRMPYELPDGIDSLTRVVVVDGEAWTLDLLRREKTLRAGDLVLTWEAGQNSIHDQRRIAKSRDVGNVTVMRDDGDALTNVAHDVTFAFAFSAFHPGGTLHTSR